MAASRFQALVVYIEHRFYGESIPLGSIESAMLDPEVRGCLTSVQALADFAEVIISLKTDLHLPNSPVIVFGGSYGGMFAAWFRMKYPHLAMGALASSAPILNSEDLPLDDQYCSIVGRDFKDENDECYNRISRSWKLIDDLESQPEGVQSLSEIFKSCSPLFSAYELKQYLAQMYKYAAQYNGRFDHISRMCDAITHASDEDILGGISRAAFTLNADGSCNNITLFAPLVFLILDPASQQAWEWQLCSELVPHEGCNENSMFEPNPFNLSTFMENCYNRYGVYPHPHWISTYFGVEDIKTALRTSASNIIFSNGLKDPLSGASILEDLSDTVRAITTEQGSHCLDVVKAKSDDPRWLQEQRSEELAVLDEWLQEASNGRSNWPNILVILICLLGVVLMS